MRTGGLDRARIASAKLAPDSVHAFVGLHSEQGQVLESAGQPLGIVTNVAAPHDVRVTLTGRASHAEATQMALRGDAFGCCRAAVLLERPALEAPSDSMVATIGMVAVSPARSRGR
jgi:allantoate deiminase